MQCVKWALCGCEGPGATLFTPLHEGAVCASVTQHPPSKGACASRFGAGSRALTFTSTSLFFFHSLPFPSPLLSSPFLMRIKPIHQNGVNCVASLCNSNNNYQFSPVFPRESTKTHALTYALHQGLASPPKARLGVIWALAEGNV